MFAPGTLIDGRFRLERKLGQGANGVVYRARQVASGQEFALKLMLPEAARSLDARARFGAEGELAQTIQHRSVMEVLGAGLHVEANTSTPYTVMTPMVGESLDIVLLRLGALPVGTALSIVREVASALDELHELGITHGDVKPAVVFVHRPFAGGLVPKLLDFGVLQGAPSVPAPIPEPRAAAEADVEADEACPSGPCSGARAYMSPERLSGGLVDARADVWALGVMLYRAISGALPFVAAGGLAAGSRAIRLAAHTPLAECMASLPVGASELVDRCLAKRPEDRVPSARALVAEIDRVLARRPVPQFDVARLLALAAFKREVARDDYHAQAEPDADSIASALLRVADTWDNEPALRVFSAAE